MGCDAADEGVDTVVPLSGRIVDRARGVRHPPGDCDREGDFTARDSARAREMLGICYNFTRTHGTSSVGF